MENSGGSQIAVSVLSSSLLWGETEGGEREKETEKEREGRMRKRKQERERKRGGKEKGRE